MCKDCQNIALRVSVPLRGLGSWKVNSSGHTAWILLKRFSPLAGIRFVESLSNCLSCPLRLIVSVPLRGLGSWKDVLPNGASRISNVSVPLRGLGSWKEYADRADTAQIQCFSPLAGIRFVESLVLALLSVHSPVSVPLRGLGSWKADPQLRDGVILGGYVSVPLRGLGSWKARGSKATIG